MDNGDTTSSPAPASASAANPAAEPDQYRQSLLEVMRQVMYSLPDTTTFGELIAAMRANPPLEPLLRTMSVQELVDLAGSKPGDLDRGDDADHDDDNGLDVTGAVIRRRADVPDGDLVVLECLADLGPLTEAGVARKTKLTAEQIRLILRHLRTKGSVHVEGSGGKRRIKITRSGSSWLRKQRKNTRR